MRNSSELEVPVNDSHVYKVIIGRGVLENLNGFISPPIEPKLSLIGRGVHEHVPWLYYSLRKVFEEVKIVEDGEESKNLETALKIVEDLWRLGATRWSALAVASGGSLGDTAAFAASIYMRGIPFVQIPTTLLAMIDSALGGKTAVNYSGVKNILGSFYHPWLVVDDLRFLDTLPNRVFRSSLAEALKYGFTLDKGYLDFMIHNRDNILRRDDLPLIELIKQATELKLSVVSQDPRERKGIREVLNFGHTIGHVLESASNFKLLHGEAVAFGMLVESKISEDEGCKDCFNVILSTISDYAILDDVVDIIPELDFQQYKELLYRDKKRVGDKIRLPMLKEIGKWELVLYPFESFAEKSYKAYREILKKLKG
ncbi:3-dehydroquinate synthase [Ignicoccus pacificus DSM 13166]|uniref:3-dehydroquinate synthase n=1 Tax=Ignicoccus pacificus DSM 13166 TaxID=940294 RepID=A0A977PK13_9CREN|nr:3-dehydroquinate synthase [Ignicoccus pacificus DSM 13166]